ncbi:hypothetical protein KL86DPRO_11369 [uncultured delta proteobacterium]|uniref:Uncharacterized protein n=1 Tax=uncultured delta proteobacterium TaxID=34034 RepID=A0A212JGD1_9DELT|nr:hypothetical protein KL86DPRO_11369 [uncultured delta proteobacterium]
MPGAGGREEPPGCLSGFVGGFAAEVTYPSTVVGPPPAGGRGATAAVGRKNLTPRGCTGQENWCLSCADCSLGVRGVYTGHTLVRTAVYEREKSGIFLGGVAGDDYLRLERDGFCRWGEGGDLPGRSAARGGLSRSRFFLEGGR